MNSLEQILSSFNNGLFSVSFDVPPRPKIVKNKIFDCGRTIEVEWKQIKGRGVTGYELVILSVVDDSRQRFHLSNEDHFMKLDVQSNNLYEIQIRAKNALGYSFWTKRQLESTAGTN